MSSLRLESFSHEEFQAEAIRYGLTPSATRPRLIDQIMSHLEQHGPLLDMRNEQPAVDSVVLPDRNTTHNRSAQISNASPGLPSVSTQGDQFQVLLEEMKLQKELFQQMFKAMQSNQQVSVANPVVSFSGSERATVSSVPERFPMNTFSQEACVSLKEPVIVNTGTLVKVTSLNNFPCNLTALIDSGSYASFISVVVS